MSFRLVSEGWGTELENALRRDRSELRIVSPFIKHPALQRLLALRPERIRVVTRFDLEGFARSVSDVAALRTLLESGASVRGLRALHAKLYIFGDNVAVVTSANLTVAGLDTNPEFGIVTEDPAAVRRCRDYFDDLWHRARDDLRLDEVDRWTADLARYLATGADRAGSRFLPDYGVDVVRPAPSRVLAPSVFTDAEHATVKFHGRGEGKTESGFIEQCRRTLNAVVWETKRTRDPYADTWKPGNDLPAFLAGGGAANRLHQDVMESVGTWLKRDVRNEGIRTLDLPAPKTIDLPELLPDFGRMVVAWGLSYPPTEIGRIDPMSDIGDISPREIVASGDRFVSKDHV